MKLTGKQHRSSGSYVEFEVDALPDADAQEEIIENQHSYDGIWMGKSDVFEGSVSIMIGFDFIQRSDLDLLKPVLSGEDFETIKDAYRMFQ